MTGRRREAQELRRRPRDRPCTADAFPLRGRGRGSCATTLTGCTLSRAASKAGRAAAPHSNHARLKLSTKEKAEGICSSGHIYQYYCCKYELYTGYVTRAYTSTRTGAHETHPSLLVVAQQTFPPHAFRTCTTKGARLPCPPVTTKVCPRVVDSLNPASSRGHKQLTT